VLANAKLIITNPWTTLILPWIIVGIILAINWLIWLLIVMSSGAEAMSNASAGMAWSGASMYLFFYMMVIAIQAVNASFPLALGWGSTRRDFILGSAVVWVGLSLVYSVGFTILSMIERATNGWGLGGVMFNAVYYGDGPWHERFLISLALFLFFFFIGSAFAAAYVRWKAMGLIVSFALLAFLLIGGAAIVTFTDSWSAVWATIGDLGVSGIAAWSLVATALAGLVAWGLLRRATPRN
jgi:hypothetical protein